MLPTSTITVCGVKIALPFCHDWFETMDEGAKETGSSVQLPGDLIYRRDVVPGLPAVDDLPCSGYLEQSIQPSQRLFTKQ